mmetsp:Transcript_19546/g.25837  ORF Transcript_19546/g.25837 Transcript_19546/m.25837 type:complete len:256 (+) Transcript_19546:138-905(+)
MTCTRQLLNVKTCIVSDQIKLGVLVITLFFNEYALAQEHRYLRQGESLTWIKLPLDITGVNLKTVIFVIFASYSLIRVLMILKRNYAIKRFSISRSAWIYHGDKSQNAIESESEFYLPKNRPPYFVPVKFDKKGINVQTDHCFHDLPGSEGDIEMSEKLPLSNNSPTSSVVTFHDDVKVYPILKAKEYPINIRISTWTPSKEIIRNRLRNCKEFQYDGWDWRAASEEEDMYFDHKRGELVHPVHASGKIFSCWST